MKQAHTIFEIIFFAGLVLAVLPFFIQRLYPVGIVLGLILMVLSATRERVHLLKHK